MTCEPQIRFYTADIFCILLILWYKAKVRGRFNEIHGSGAAVRGLSFKSARCFRWLSVDQEVASRESRGVARSLSDVTQLLLHGGPKLPGHYHLLAAGTHPLACKLWRRQM